MQLHKENYSVSYTNNICVSLLHASSNKIANFTFVLLLIYAKNKAYTQFYDGIGMLAINSN